MAAVTSQQQLCRHFAELFSYPGPSLRTTAAHCAGLLRDRHPDAVEPFSQFTRFLEEQPASRLEEVYTATFDLQPACYPYVAYQLCGESQKRTLFLMKLQQLYREHGFTGDGELPDHLATVLRFIAGSDDRACCEELIGDGLLPAIDRMLAQAETTTNPYIQLLQVVRLALALGTPAATVMPLEPRRKEARS